LTSDSVIGWSSSAGAVDTTPIVPKSSDTMGLSN
jgi:hypothetical protein